VTQLRSAAKQRGRGSRKGLPRRVDVEEEFSERPCLEGGGELN